MTALAFLLWLAAGDYPPSPLSDWYKSLRQPGTGISCCDISDCRPVEARTSGEGWEFDASGRWVAVPSTKVIQNKPNPTGRAVACYVGAGDTVVLFCFVPPSMA